MKVKDLIKQLKKFNPEQKVVCYSDDAGLRTMDGPIQIFEINNIEEKDAVGSRLNEGKGKPRLSFGKSEISSKYLLIDITSDI